MINSRKTGQKINADSSIKAKLEAMREETLAELHALTGNSFVGQKALAYA